MDGMEEDKAQRECVLRKYEHIKNKENQ